MASLSLDLSIRLWDLKQRRTLQVLGDNESVVKTVQGTTARIAFSLDGQRLASVSALFLVDKTTYTAAGLLQLWSVGTGAKLGVTWHSETAKGAPETAGGFENGMRGHRGVPGAMGAKQAG